MSDNAKPPSATNPLIGLAGLVTLFGLLFVLKDHGTLEAYIRTIIMVLGVTIVMIAADIIFNGIPARSSTGLNWKNPQFSVKRSAVKLFGLSLSILLIAVPYLIFPEYAQVKYYPVWEAIRFVLPVALPLAVLYMIVIDAVMENPKDGYYNFGLIALGRFKDVDTSKIAPHVRSWMIKGFFTPLMFVFLNNNMQILPFQMNGDWAQDFTRFYLFAFFLVFSIDLIFTLGGYLFSLRLIDTHERSSEPTTLGWVAALACYPPMAILLSRAYLSYESEENWLRWVDGRETLMIVWGSVIIILLGIYSWATVAFGLRFSNLTHRGIITSGPYRFTKHPAYIAKNLSWWLMSVPFIPFESGAMAVKHSIFLLMMNGIYLLRAYTEERHLARDPVYRDYQAWILKNGIFRWLPFKLAAKPLHLS